MVFKTKLISSMWITISLMHNFVCEVLKGFKMKTHVQGSLKKIGIYRWPDSLVNHRKTEFAMI